MMGSQFGVPANRTIYTRNTKNLFTIDDVGVVMSYGIVFTFFACSELVTKGEYQVGVRF